MGNCSFLGWGSCALAWAVKEVPDSEAGPPDAELPRQTELAVAILAQGSRDPGAMAPGPLEPWVGMAFAVPR